MVRWLDGIIDSADMSLSKPRETEGQEACMLQSTGSQRAGHDRASEQQQVGDQVCGFQTKLIPTLPPPTCSSPLLPTPWLPSLVPELSLGGTGLGPGSRPLLGA